MPNIERLQSTILRTLTDIYLREVKDNNLGFITITEVRLTNDFSYLTIFYTILGQDSKKDAAGRALERSKSFVRTRLANRVKMRKSPQLKFRYDESLAYGNRISEGLKNLK